MVTRPCLDNLLGRVAEVVLTKKLTKLVASQKSNIFHQASTWSGAKHRKLAQLSTRHHHVRPEQTPSWERPDTILWNQTRRHFPNKILTFWQISEFYSIDSSCIAQLNDISTKYASSSSPASSVSTVAFVFSFSQRTSCQLVSPANGFLM